MSYEHTKPEKRTGNETSVSCETERHFVVSKVEFLVARNSCTFLLLCFHPKPILFFNFRVDAEWFLLLSEGIRSQCSSPCVYSSR